MTGEVRKIVTTAPPERRYTGSEITVTAYEYKNGPYVDHFTEPYVKAASQTEVVRIGHELADAMWPRRGYYIDVHISQNFWVPPR